MATSTSTQTLTTFGNLLKNKYLPALQVAFNNESILLNRLKRSTATIVGNRYEFPLHARRNFGTGPRAETGTDAATPPYLPAPGHQTLDRGYLSRTHYYTRFKVTGATLSAAKGDGAMVDVLGTEMRGAKDDLAKHVTRDLYGDTSADGRLATCGTTTGANTVVVGSTHNLEAGMPVVIAATATGTMVTDGSITIDTIDSSTTFSFTGNVVTTSSAHAVYPGGLHNTTTSSAYGNACSGLEQIVNSVTGTYAGINRATAGNDYFHPTRIDGSAGLSIDLMLTAQQDMRKKANGKLSIVLCDAEAWRAYGNLIAPDRRWVGSIRKLDGGFDSLDFNGVPLVWDPDCPANTMYFLDESTFQIVEEEPINFMDRDGAVLVRVGSGTTAQDAYEATLIWRFNLKCNNPGKNCTIYDMTY